MLSTTTEADANSEFKSRNFNDKRIREIETGKLKSILSDIGHGLESILLSK